MAIVSSDFLAGVLTNFQATFNRRFPAAMAAALWPQLAMRVTSDTDTESHEWFGTVPPMRDRSKGRLEVGDLEEYSLSLKNITYGTGIVIKQSAFEDDKLGLIQPKIAQLPEEAAAHPGRLIFDLFEDNPTAYDGITFFNDTRVLGLSANIDNEVEGAYGDGTVAEFQAGLRAGAARMAEFQDDHGRVELTQANTLVIPTALVETAWQSLDDTRGRASAPSIPQGAMRNFQAGGYNIIVNGQLSSAVNWYMLHVGEGEDRPFIFQSRLVPSVTGPADPNDYEIRELEQMTYSVRGRYVVGVGEPRNAVKIVDSG